MMFFEASQLEESILPPVTRTGKLAIKVEEIKNQVSNGNTIRYVSGVSASVGILGLILGSTALSPFVSLLFLVGAGSSTASYLAHALHEANKLKIDPVWIPTTEGGIDQVLAEILPMQERLLWIAIDNFGAESVETLEYAGHLDYLLRSIKAIKVRGAETAVEDFNSAIQQIGNHYFPQLSQLNPALPVRQVSQRLKEIDQPVSPVEEETDDLWDDFDSTQSPIVESLYETNDLDDEETNNWSIFDSLKKSNESNAVPTENIAQQIAAATKSHFCFVAEPQTGKSSLLISTIELIKGDVYFVDCKGDDLRFRNLKKVNSGSKYLKVNEENSLKTFFKLLDALLLTMIERQSNTDRSPITFVVDEINILINIIESYQIETGEKNLLNKFKGKFMRLLNQGLSSGIRVIFTTHTTKVVELFGTSSALHAVSLIGLGKINKTNSINDCIDYKIRQRHRNKISEKVEKALEQNPESVIALLCYTSPPRIVSIPLVNYDHLLTGVESKNKIQTKKIEFPTFDDDLEDTPNEVIQPVACTPNDLLTQLEKMRNGAHKPSYISSLTKWKVSDIEMAANELHLAGEIELRNWDKAQGRAIVYYSQEQDRYENSKVVMGNFGMAAHLGV